MALVLLAGACSSGGDTVAPVMEQFTGDRDSEFCVLSRQGEREPFLDPFDAGLTPFEVETRFRALDTRFRALADAAPPELREDLRRIVAAFDDFMALLDDADFDFAVLAGQDVDVSLFDDPIFEEIGARIDAYQRQVCAAR